MRDDKRHSGERRSAKARWMGIIAAAGIMISGSAPAMAQPPPPPPPPAPPPGFEGQGQVTVQVQPPGYGGYGQPPPPPPPGAYYAPPPGGTMIMGPKVLDWEDGEPLRPGYHADTRIRKGLVIGGAVTFGVMWLLTAFGAAIAQTAGAGSEVTPLYIPAIGPFIAVATIKPIPMGTFFFILDGLTQSAGVAMFIAGLAAPKSVQVRNDAKTFIKPIPMTFGANSGGFGLVGKF